MTAGLAAAAALPFLLAPVSGSARLWWTPAVAPLGALAAALLVPTGNPFELPWLLLGCTFALDATSRVFLAFSALVWAAAGWVAMFRVRADPRAGRFRVLFLLAMGGNLWAIAAQDLVSFYAGFSVMGIAAFGLVVHEASRQPGGPARVLEAGRVYLAMTLGAELALFSALVLIARETGTLTPTPADLAEVGDGALVLLILGLAVKAGLVPLHLWLPPTYANAPEPVAAVLAGAMSKLALLGWLRWLPLGESASLEWGALLILLGLASLVLGCVIGLIQSDARAVLAYSSVAKAGLLTLTLGLIWIHPELAPVGIAAVALYAAHHGLVKSALFLGVGQRAAGLDPGLALTGLLFLALAMAGAPVTSGAVVKAGIKPMVAADWAWLDPFVWVTTAAMALLMLRFLWTLEVPERAVRRAQTADLGWLSLLAVVLVFPFLAGDPADWLGSPVPLLAALAITLPFWLAARIRPGVMAPLVGAVPPGDLLVLARPATASLGWLGGLTLGLWLRAVKALQARVSAWWQRVDRGRDDIEAWLRGWPHAGALWLGVLLVLLAGALMLTQPDAPAAAGRPG